MQVSYNGLTGELQKLEAAHTMPTRYNLEIYDPERKATYSFAGIELKKVCFICNRIMFNNVGVIFT